MATRIFLLFAASFLVQCGVKKDPIAQHQEDGPHSALKAQKK